jgi:protein KRI1
MICTIVGMDGDAASKLGADNLEEYFDQRVMTGKCRRCLMIVTMRLMMLILSLEVVRWISTSQTIFDLPNNWALDESKKGFSAADEEATKAKKNSLKDKVELEKELEEYYKLDYKDTIRDLKTQFKYK